jgi:hypothetical protein
VLQITALGASTGFCGSVACGYCIPDMCYIDNKAQQLATYALAGVHQPLLQCSANRSPFNVTRGLGALDASVYTH